MIYYVLFALVGAFWIFQGCWLIVSAVWDIIRLLLFGVPGDSYRDGDGT